MISDDTYGILNRLILNQHIEPSPEGLLRLLGFVHLYTASGLHLIALESFLSRFFVRDLAMKKILTVCFWIFLLIIWKLQDFRLGFARVLVLFLLRSLARVKGYRWRVYYPLFLAFCFDFSLGIDSGWQHYYLAVLGGMLGAEYARKRNPFIQHLYLSVASWLMTAPLDLFYHHTISWMTPLWSMATIPIIALFLYPLSVLSYFIFGMIPSWLTWIWNGGIGLLLKVVDHHFTFSVVGNQYWWISFLAALLCAIVYLNLKCNKNRLILCIFLIISLFSIKNRNHKLELVQFDVGQGDSLMIQKNERVEVIDLGTSRKVKPDKVLMRFTHYGVTKIDTLLLSHLDEDHAGALRLLLPWMPIGSIEVNSRLERTVRVKEWLHDFPAVSWCEAGCMQLANVDWILSHPKRIKKSKKEFTHLINGNDLMATAIIPLSESEVYIALGDSGFEQESEFWKRHRDDVLGFPTRILKISHHGSRFSSDANFINAVSPARAIISVGKHNHYHHPHYSVVNQLIKSQIPIHRTDRDGDFVFVGSGK